jgi:crotonobetainyl-CoA:carnitine CoA-transferase CaiB-like acyl-CoA transferase
VTGYIGGPPSKVGQSFVDFLATWTALFAIGAALRYRNRTGKGQWIDIGMYQCGVMFISEYILDYIANERLPERIGNRHPYFAPQGCYRAKGEDEWIALSVTSDEEWEALCRLIGRPELASDPRFADALSRARNHDALDDIITSWTVQHDRYELMEMLQRAGIAAGPVFNARDTHLDPHYKARGFLEMVEYPEDRGIGVRPFIGRPWKFSKSPVRIQRPAPRLGGDNEAILVELLGRSLEEYEALERDGVIGKAPKGGRPIPTPDLAELVRKGRLAAWDPNYKEKLGIP